MLLLGRQKKDARYLNLYIQRSIYDDFVRFCDDVGQTKTMAAERALVRYMQQMKDFADSQERENAQYGKNK